MDSSPNDLKPWHRQPGESEADYLRFKTWLMAAHAGGGKTRKRSISATAEFLGLNRPVVARVAAAHRWTARASAYDSHTIAQHATGALADLEEMRAQQNRIINVGMSVLELSLERLKATLEGKNAAALASIKLDVPKLFDMVLKYQNLLYGQATESVTATVEFGAEWDLSALSLDELRTLKAIREKTTRKTPEASGHGA